MNHLIEKHDKTNRVVVCDDTSALVNDIANELNCSIVKIPSGKECLTWVIPDQWEVKEAWINLPNGEKLVDYKDNPLYVKAMSLPFKGSISKTELLGHIKTNPDNPDWFYYDYGQIYSYTKDKWGFSLPYNMIKDLPDGEYEVNIDTEFSKGTMDIIDYTIKGRKKETIIFSAHTCHPAQVNDGLACCSMLVELFKWIKTLGKTEYSYRLILGPEYFTGAAVMDYEKNPKKNIGGFYFDMIGNGKKFGFSSPYAKNTMVEDAFIHALNHLNVEYFNTPYRKLWGNDEMFYDGPDFEIPFVCPARDKWEYYHTDQDNIENFNFEQADEVLNIMKQTIDIFEKNIIPKRKYKGPLYLSKNQLMGDLRNSAIFPIFERFMNGKNTCLDVAKLAEVNFYDIYEFYSQLEQKGLAKEA